MPTLTPCELPPAALLRKYKDGIGYVDCYVAEVDLLVSQEDFVQAFYTTALFKVERVILKWFAGRPSTDGDARALARGANSAFAAWSVEDRTNDQILLADFTGRTRSWLMTASVDASAGELRTLLYFGSAVVPRVSREPGRQNMGFAFHALLGFHRLYSRMLLKAARSRVLHCVKGRSGHASSDA